MTAQYIASEKHNIKLQSIVLKIKTTQHFFKYMKKFYFLCGFTTILNKEKLFKKKLRNI